MNTVLLLLAGFGLTNIIVNGTILNSIRDWLFKKSNFLKSLLICSLCVGFWSGVYISLVASIVTFGSPLFYFLTVPFACSGVSWILERGGSIIDYIAYKQEGDN